jgi:hypothetical protein
VYYGQHRLGRYDATGALLAGKTAKGGHSSGAAKTA